MSSPRQRHPGGLQRRGERTYEEGTDAAQELHDALATIGTVCRGLRAGIPQADGTPVVHTEDLPTEAVRRLALWIRERR